jgi:hypothetical protein
MTGIAKYGGVYQGLDEPLHAFIAGKTVEEVQVRFFFKRPPYPKDNTWAESYKTLQL